MKRTLAAIASLFLTPVASGGGARARHLRENRLDADAPYRSGEPAVAVAQPQKNSSNGRRSLEHGEKRKQRKKERAAENSEGSEVAATDEATTSTLSTAAASDHGPNKKQHKKKKEKENAVKAHEKKKNEGHHKNGGVAAGANEQHEKKEKKALKAHEKWNEKNYDNGGVEAGSTAIMSKAEKGTAAVAAAPTTTTTSATTATEELISTSSTMPVELDTASSESTSSATAYADEYDPSDYDFMPELRSSQNNRQDLHVRHIYTYGAPSVMKNPAMSNPGGACVPGLRVFTEDVEVKTCSWWEQMWCTEGRQVTNVDFASQINVKEGYPHAKMATLVIRLVDQWKVEYVYKPCRDYDGVAQYNHQMWPPGHLDSGMLPGFNVHRLHEDYEPRLLQVPYYVRGPALEYVSIARCVYRSTHEGIHNCLNQYRENESPSRQGGAGEVGWELAAVMDHETTSSVPWDSDSMSIFRNDRDPDRRRCIVGFQGSDHLADLANFVLGNADEVSYCGRHGVHGGTVGELRGITSDRQYRDVIVPALEECDEVTCVGHSLGGSLCQLFMYCANADPEGFHVSNGLAKNDYESLVWDRKKKRR